MDGGAWWATVHRVAKSQTRLSDFTHFSLSHIFFFPSLSPELMIMQQTTQFKHCTKDYITTVYPA